MSAAEIKTPPAAPTLENVGTAELRALGVRIKAGGPLSNQCSRETC
jgi:hypothetical protein